MDELTDEQIIAEAERRFGPGRFRPSEVLRNYHEQRVIAAAHAGMQRARERAAAELAAALDHVGRRAEYERAQAARDLAELTEPARRAHQAALAEVFRRFQERLGELGEQVPAAAWDHDIEQRYADDVARVRAAFDMAMQPHHEAYEQIVREIYDAHELAINSANARYRDTMATAREEYDRLTADAVRDAHQRGDHRSCPVEHCAVAAARSI